MATVRSDITLPPDLKLKSGTGPVRHQEPIFVDSIPPCNHACPAGEDIQAKAYNLHRNLDEERVSLIETVAVKGHSGVASI